MIIDKLLIDDTNMDKQNITNKQVISKKGGQIMKKNVFKRVICLVIALMMIMPNLQGSMAYAEGSVPTADDIVLEKTATAVDGKMNTYDIQLSVTGKKIVIPKKADVILVLDNSNSMHNEKSNGKTLAKITEEAAHAFINGVLTADNNGNIRVAVVQYGTEARARDFKGTGSWTGNWSSSLNLSGKTVYTSDNSDAKDAVTEALTKFWYSGDGGTNTEGGFLMAQKVAGQKRTDAESIVIFMTDGLPTYRYRSNGNATSDGYGNQTSKQELNEAIDAAISLSDNGSIIYTVGLLSSFGSGSNQAKLAANLLSETPMKYDDDDDDNIMGFVNYSNRWKPASKYTQKYYPIYSNEDAPKKMKEIYEGLASIVMELATGYVVDVIPEYFELTPESKAALEGAGAEVDVTEDGVTTITYKNVSANETTTDLQGYTVVAKPGYYGTAYTNKDSDGKSAIYHYTLNTSEPKPTGTKEFPQPVVAINPTAIDDPTAADDYYTAKMGQTLTVGTEDSILNNDETNVLNDGGYTISPLKVHPDYVNKDIATTAGGKVVIAEDGSFVYTPPEVYTISDTFEYQNYVNVYKDDDVHNLNGDYLSNKAIVKINLTDTVEETIDIVVEKTWYDNEPVAYRLFNDEGPVYPDITIRLWADGVEVASTVLKHPDTVYVFENYPMYNDDDKEIEYTVTEDEVEGYSTYIEGSYADAAYYVYIYNTLQSYNVYYDPNGGEGDIPEPQTEKYGRDVTVLSNPFTREGYEFSGWNTEEDGSGTDYEPGNTFQMPAHDVTLYAQWAKIGSVSYTVYYLDSETHEEIREPKVVSNQVPGDTVTEDAIDIPGYVKVPPTTKSIVLGEDDNEIKFYYTKQEVIEDADYHEVVWKYETGYNTGVYTNRYKLSGEGEPEPIQYYIELHYDSGYTFKRYNTWTVDEEVEVIVDATSGSAITGTAIETTTFIELFYDRDRTGGGGGGGGGGGTIIEEPEVPLAELEKLDHFAYIIGYPEGDIRPLNNITREEVAMIFYRLLTDESRDAFLSDVNPFPDVEGDRWSNRAISTLFNAGIISGYPDGTFRPSAPISRAEFATIAAKFDNLDLGMPSEFTDIVGHWAEEYITSAENKGWVNGYPDMTFKPDQDITRAESMTLINNVLERAVPKENIHPDAIFWPDISEDDWYFEIVMEATNSHDYTIEEDGDELWIGLKPNKVWP